MGIWELSGQWLFDRVEDDGRYDMPAKNEKQRRAAGMALAARRGKIDPGTLYGAAKEMYRSMTLAELRKFAKSIKH